MFNSPDARKCSISFDKELSRGDISQNQTANYDEEAINILNIFIRNNETKTDDEALVSISLILQRHSTFSGYYLDISVYREITDKVTGETTFESYSGKRGPFHGRLLRTL